MAEEAQILGTGNFRYEAKRKEESEVLSTGKKPKADKNELELPANTVEEESKSEGKRVTIVDDPPSMTS